MSNEHRQPREPMYIEGHHRPTSLLINCHLSPVGKSAEISARKYPFALVVGVVGRVVVRLIGGAGGGGPPKRRVVVVAEEGPVVIRRDRDKVGAHLVVVVTVRDLVPCLVVNKEARCLVEAGVNDLRGQAAEKTRLE